MLYYDYLRATMPLRDKLKVKLLIVCYQTLILFWFLCNLSYDVRFLLLFVFILQHSPKFSHSC